MTAEIAIVWVYELFLGECELSVIISEKIREMLLRTLLNRLLGIELQFRFFFEMSVTEKIVARDEFPGTSIFGCDSNF